MRRMIATWRSQDPAAQADLLLRELRAAETDITEVRHDRHVPDPPRFGSRDGLLYQRWTCEDRPAWRIGYTDRTIMLMADLPEPKAVRQRRISLLRWESFSAHDTDREQRIYTRVAEAASRAGLNPYEAKVEWTLGAA